MPLTSDQLDNWFTYHAPTPETAPKYKAIRDAQEAAQQSVDNIYNGLSFHDDINFAMRAFAEVIDTLAPDSADKSAAIRCVRLARNAANEALAGYRRPEGIVRVRELTGMAEADLLRARWQANSAIACGGR